MRKNIVAGIDVGSHAVKVVIATIDDSGAPPHIIGTGSAVAHGMRHGYVVHKDDCAESIKKAIARAEEEAGVTIQQAHIAVGGESLEAHYAKGDAIVSRANSEVSEIDMENAIAEAEARMAREMVNRRVIHAIPVAYYLDGQHVLGNNPVGMRASKIEAEVMLISILEPHLNDLVEAVEMAGVAVSDVVESPLAASLVTLSKKQKMVGCVLANIGAETTSVLIFEDDTPISLKVFPIGSANITHAIALELRIPLGEAEVIKKGSVTGGAVPQRKINDIIASNTRTILTNIQDHLKKINRAGLLPAGIILTGGGSGIADIDEYAKAVLKLPAEVAGTRLGSQRLKDASWAVAYGLCIIGASDDIDTIGMGSVRRFLGRLLSWLKRFLP